MKNWIVLIGNTLIPTLLFIPCAELAPTFTATPPDPFYLLEGNNITFVWQYNFGATFRSVVFRSIGSSALVILNKHDINLDAAVPKSFYKGRIQENINATQADITIFALQRSESGEYDIELTDINFDTANDRVTVQVQYPPEFNNVSSDVVVEEGDPSVTLECIADGEPKPTITWTKVYANGSDGGVLQTANQYILETNRSNIGTYRCTASNGIGTAPNHTVIMEIHYPPEFNNVSSDVVVVEDDPSITLECIADGEPTPNIAWTKVYANGSDSGVLGTGNQFVLETNRNNSGKYRCTANNGIGIAPNRTVKVEVNYKPENVKLMVNDSIVCEGDVISITCSADGKPAVHTYQLFENERSVNDGNRSAGVWMRKYLKGGDLSYRCVANNTVGTAEKTVNVTVKVPSIVYPLENITVIEGENRTLTCNVSGSPVLAVAWTEVSSRNQSSGVVRYLTNISRKNAGEYKCEATNDCRNSSASTFLTVLYKPENVQLISSAMDHKACTGEVISFNCSANANPGVTSYQLFENETAILNTSALGMWNKTLESGGVFVYKCVANNSIGSEYSMSITVTVNDKPENVQLMSSAMNNKACKGKVISFNCSANANLGVTSYQLFENETAILNTSASGMWNKTLESEGVFVYKCVANNSLGSEFSMSVTVTVNVPSSLQVIDDKKVIEGDNVTLLCRVSGMPSPMVSWMTPNGQRRSGYMLEVKSINRSQAGEYKCEAINECGNATKTASIHVQFKLPGNPCLVECTNGRACREFGKHFCLCPKGKKGKDCKENDTVATVIMISLKINNKKWREELTDLSDLDTQLFVGTITRSVGEEFKGSGVREISVIHLREGSVIADISLTFDKPVGESEVESLLLDAFNNGSLGNLKVDTFSVGSTIPDSVTVPGPVPSEPAKVNKDVIYGSVIGVLALILAVIIIFTAWKRRQREKDDRLDTGIEESREPYVNEGFELESRSGNLSTVVHHGPGHYMDLNEVRSLNEPATDPARCYLEINEYAPLHPGTRSWEVERENVTIEKVIGKGAFGQVAQGKASNLRGREETITVAIKMLKGNATDTERKDLLSELEVMKKLKPHPHVIRLLGCVTESDPFLVLIEYVPYGDLLGYLRKSRQLEDNYFKDPDIKPQTSLTSQQLMKFSWQVADGMHYLSSKNIIHRDLAARNVLVGERERCKVTDFGMARDVCQENIYERKSKGRLPVKWTACEALLYGRYTTKSDVWSFGIVLYEIFTIGGSPYPKIPGRKMADLLTQGYRMPKPRHVDETLYKIMQDCWQENPDDRPMFENLRNDLKEMENQHQRLINMKHYDNILYAGMD